MKRKEQLTVYVPTGLATRIRAAVWSLAGPPEHLNLSEIATRALERECAALEKKYNGGKPFPKAGSLKRGRPLKG